MYFLEGYVCTAFEKRKMRAREYRRRETTNESKRDLKKGARAPTKNDGIPRYFKLGIIRQEVYLLVEAELWVEPLGRPSNEYPVILQAQSIQASLARRMGVESLASDRLFEGADVWLITSWL